MTRTFAIPFLGGACLFFWVADRAPQRFEATMLVGIPRSGAAGAPARRRDELAGLRLLFRSPGRIESTLAGRPEARALLRGRDPARLAARIARQTVLGPAPGSTRERLLVEVRTWATERGIPALVLRSIAEDLVRRLGRLTATLPKRLEEVGARREAQARIVARDRAELEEFVAKLLPPGEVMDDTLRANLLRRSRLVQALLDGEGEDRGELASRLELPPDARVRYRSLREGLGEALEVLEEIEAQENEMQERVRAVGSAAAPLEIVRWPEGRPRPTPKSRASLALVSAVVGSAVGFLALFLRLLVRQDLLA